MTKYLEFDTPAAKQREDLKSAFGLDNHGLVYLDRVFWNLPEPALYEEAVFRGEGHLSLGGPFLVTTGKHTARAAADKYIVLEDSTAGEVWWGDYNRPCSEQKFDALRMRLQAFLQDEELFVQDCYAGADPNYRMPIRIIAEKAWHSLFARNMFLLPETQEEYRTHVPEFTVVAVPSFKVDPRVDGTRTETAIIIDFRERIAVICNSAYSASNSSE